MNIIQSTPVKFSCTFDLNCSPTKSSKVVKQLAPSIFYNKGRNIVYLGCNGDEVERYLKSIGNFYRCEEMTVRKPKYNTDFEREIVIRDMYAEANFYAYGLDSLVNEQNLKHLDRGGWKY